MVKVLCFVVLAARLLEGQDNTFNLSIDNPVPYTRTYLGNGHLGVATSALGTTPVESFMAGLYDAAPEDVPRLAALPAWNEVNVFNDRTWLNDVDAGSGSLEGYRQTLNMQAGSLRTEYRWVSQEHAVSVVVEMFVSRLNPDLACVKLEVTPHYSGPLRVWLALRGWKQPRRFALARLERVDPALSQQQLWYPGHMIVVDRGAVADQGGGQIHLVSRPEGVSLAVAEAAELAWPAGLPGITVRQTASGDVAAVEVGFDAAAEKTYSFFKYVGVARTAAADRAVRKASLVAQAALAKGYDALCRESAAEWRRLWQTDIVTDSTPELQTLVHSMLFYLLSSARADSEYGLPPMGLSTAGYYGHVFWDADTYMFPPLMVLHPEMAKPIVMFRFHTLEAAKANARRNGWKGAMYPWEAGPDGSETTPRFAWQNATSEIHVNGAVALAQWQYYLATGDRQWLARYGYPVIKETADFWTSRVTYDQARNRYEIHDVVSWIESRIGVDNDPYTNAVAAKNLELATTAAKILDEPPNPDWERVRRKLYVPEGATLLTSYLLERPADDDAKRREVEDYIKQFRAGELGVMMGSAFNPILAVEARSPQLLDEVFPYTYKPYLMPAFNVLREAPGNENINFLTGAGAFLQQFVFGYTGLRFTSEGLTRRFDPLLPKEIRKLTLKNITVRGIKRDIVAGGSTVN